MASALSGFTTINYIILKFYSKLRFEITFDIKKKFISMRILLPLFQ